MRRIVLSQMCRHAPLPQYALQLRALYKPCFRPLTLPSTFNSIMADNFHLFYKTWFERHRHLVAQLSQVAEPVAEQQQQLVNRAMDHYAEYYKAKSEAARADVLDFFLAPWSTALERSLSWIGGWRPTTAFHLVYTEASILFESHVVDILRGLHTGDLGDLSPGQFRRVSELQIQTVKEENDITNEHSDWQGDASDMAGKLYVDVDNTLERLSRTLERADQLRLKTLQALVEVLTTQQAAEFLVAAAELHFGIRVWGMKQERDRREGNSTS